MGRDHPGNWQSLRNLLKGEHCPRVHGSRGEEGREGSLILAKKEVENCIPVGKVRQQWEETQTIAGVLESWGYCLHLPSVSLCLCIRVSTSASCASGNFGGSNILCLPGLKRETICNVSGTQQALSGSFVRGRTTGSDIFMHAWIFH